MKKRILIIEDEAIVARDIEQILNNHNYKVTGIVSSANQVIELFDNKKTDLVLCDINLGKGKSGIDIARTLKAIKPDIYIIFLSAYSDEHTVSKAFDVVPDAYLTKPFSEEQLIVAIKRVFANHKNKQEEVANNLPTKREKQIIQSVAKGMTSRDIAPHLGISFETVQTHRRNLLNKYKLNSSAELIAYAINNKWID